MMADQFEEADAKLERVSQAQKEFAKFTQTQVDHIFAHVANELNKQKDALQRQINELRSRAQMIEAAPRIADVVTRMEGGNPLPPQSRSEHV